MDYKKSASNLVWLDLEMTGLDHNKNVIIEIATIVTTKDLEIIARGPVLAIYQPESVLAQMDDWCIKTHTNSGLVNRIRESKITTDEAERLTLEFIKKWVPERQSPLCGNSIGMDRRFLNKYMPNLENYLHYRIIDVSTIKELAVRWRTDLKTYEKRNCHLALEDIEDSIEELKYYIGNFIIKDKNNNNINITDISDISGKLVKKSNKPWEISQEWVDDIIRLKLPQRAKDSHKHQFGHVVVIGGSLNMAGAIIMAGIAALRVGAGLVTLVTNDVHTLWLNQKHPELMCYGFSDKKAVADLLTKADVIVLGPGLGLDLIAKDIFKFTVNYLEENLNTENNKQKNKAVIIDADGLRLWAENYKQYQNYKNFKSKVILTPHMGEAKALLEVVYTEKEITKIIQDRIATVQKLSIDYGSESAATVILKGADSLICKGKNMAVCTLGNPGMATAGMGDILSGIIAGLTGQGVNAFDASCLGVYLHAKAGDLQVEKYGEKGLIATDLLLEIRKLLNLI